MCSFATWFGGLPDLTQLALIGAFTWIFSVGFRETRIFVQAMMGKVGG